ncbi:uncharacterized protein LOC21402563 isoform X2 [Morus notabilis]|uniref:uncharacterized protein LOC21402563 isoform X2 n=1 Tax=Morus notabilis TaxID=981085 RepID=UPI000CED2126|nr:uncharacterized protein LOC21402563 isoform X2 [Morus notabilis]
MAATCFLSIRPSSSSSLIATHHRASAPSSKRPVSCPSSHYSFSAPIRLLLRENTVPTPEEDLDDYGYGFNFYDRKPFGTVLSAETLCCNVTTQIQPRKPTIRGTFWKPKTMVASILVLGVGLALTPVGPASAVELPILGSLQLSEPSNALSLPTWAVHVSSVIEWITAMVLVWQYGEKSGNESWKGLSWGTLAWWSILCMYMAFLL